MPSPKTILWMYESPLIPEKGGTERMTDLIMKGLSARGYNCMAMLVVGRDGSFSYQDTPINNLLHFLNDNHVDVIINQMAYQQWLIDTFLQNGGGQWQRQGGKLISCLHFDPQQPTYLESILAQRNKSIHDIITITKQILFYPYYINRHNKNFASIYNHIYDKSDAFILLSETHFPYIKRLMKRQDYSKLYAINNPLTFLDISDEGILESKKHQVLIVARMDEYYKRISLALKTWQKVMKNLPYTDWELILVGDGPSLNDYKQYVQAHQIKNIRFMGQQSPEPYYQDASIFLMTSSKEGWGLTLTESLQRGVVPIVMNSSPVFQEIIQNEYNGYSIPNKDIKLMANKIIELIKSPIQLKQIATNALKSASKYKIQTIIDKWIDIIEQ